MLVAALIVRILIFWLWVLREGEEREGGIFKPEVFFFLFVCFFMSIELKITPPEKSKQTRKQTWI